MSFGIPVRNGLSVSLVSSTFLSSGRRLNPALNLDFLTGGPLDPRITFSRTSQATLVDSTGKLTYAPNNLFTNSQDFEASAWPKTAATVTANSAVAPDGTTTADTFIPNTTATNHALTAPAIAPVGTSTFSVYAKAAGYNFLVLLSSVANVSFNLSNGTVSSSTGSPQTSITPVGNGWYRCSMTIAITATSTLYISGGSSSAAAFFGGAGDGTSGIHLWGAQLEQVTYQTTPGTYNSTSPKNLLGYTQEFDNAAWTKSNAFVQTNLATYSQDFTNAAWTKQEMTVTGNAAVAPDGTTTASNCVPTTLSSTHQISSGALVASSACVISIYAKNNGYNTIEILDRAAAVNGASFNLTTGAVTNIGTGVGSAVAVGGGWYRCSVAVTTTGMRIYIPSSSSTFSGNGTSGVLLWGAQLVQGSTAGDYQRTDAAAAAVQYVAPDGSRTADKVVPTTTNADHFVRQTATVTNATHSYTVYAKADGYGFLSMQIASDAFYTKYFEGVFNLTTGAVEGTGRNVTYTGSRAITALGNGWYRCQLIVNNIDANSTTIATALPLSTNSPTTTYAGDGTSGVFLWGAQLSNSASLDPYVYNPVAAPTSAAYYGPRFDYDPVTLANKGLLIEEQRTNLLTYSEQFDNAAWSKTAVTLTANAISSPDGTANAELVVATTTSALHLVSTALTVAAQTHTLSIYAKSAGYRFVMYTNNGGTNAARGFDLSNGTTFANTDVAYNDPTSWAITPIGNGWYRCSITFTKTSSVSCGFGLWLNNGSADTFAGNGTSGIYIYGAQLEAGSFATSYIPTVASQVTRTADVALMQGANFSNWYNQNEGTFVVGSSRLSVSALDGITASAYTDANNNIELFARTADNRLLVFNGGATQVNLIDTGKVSAGVPFTTAAAYALNNYALTTNGGTVLTDASATVPTAVALGIGSRSGNLFYNGHIRRIGYYNTRLPNTALVSLTAPNIIPSLSLDFTTQVFNVG